MKYNNIIDFHVHTDNSPDGHHSALNMCEAACERGVRAIAFTDHVEVDCYYDDDFDFEKALSRSYYDTKKAACAFDKRLIVCAGVELGQANHDIKTAEKILADRDYDFILASLHNLKDEPDFCFPDYSDLDVYAILDEYFDEMLEICEWGGFSSLAHMTYPLRYIQGNYGIKVDMSVFSEKTDAVLTMLRDKGKALEINTSGLHQKLGLTMPDESVVRRFKEIGGKYVTVGSDAHYSKHVAYEIDEAMDMALRCGFENITLFDKREPLLVPIE